MIVSPQWSIKLVYLFFGIKHLVIFLEKIKHLSIWIIIHDTHKLITSTCLREGHDLIYNGLTCFNRQIFVVLGERQDLLLTESFLWMLSFEYLDVFGKKLIQWESQRYIIFANLWKSNYENWQNCTQYILKKYLRGGRKNVNVLE